MAGESSSIQDSGCATFLSVDIACIECEYNLRGLKPDGRCPECGKRIAESLAEHERWKDLPRQLGPMRRGLWLLAASQALWLAGVPWIMGRMWDHSDWLLEAALCVSGNRPWVMAIALDEIAMTRALVTVFGAASLLLQCRGGWLVTQVALPQERMRRRRRARLLLRWLVLASAVLLVVGALWVVAAPLLTNVTRKRWGWLMGTLLLMDLLLPLLMAFRFNELAYRLGRGALGRLMTVAGCGIAGANLLLAIHVAYYLLKDDHLSSLLVNAGVFGLAVMNLLWLPYVVALARTVGRAMQGR